MHVNFFIFIIFIFTPDIRQNIHVASREEKDTNVQDSEEHACEHVNGWLVGWVDLITAEITAHEANLCGPERAHGRVCA